MEYVLHTVANAFKIRENEDEKYLKNRNELNSNKL